MSLETKPRLRSIDAGYPGVLLTTRNAARLAGVPEGSIWQGIATGDLPACPSRRSGRDVWLVPLAELRRRYGTERRPPIEELSSPEDVRLRERLARLEGELTASDRIERASQRYADKLEGGLAELAGALEAERKKSLTLARALGQVEGQRDRLARLEAASRPRGFWGRLLGR